MLLRLDSSKARHEIGWKPRLSLAEAVTKVVEWHAEVARGGDARAISLRQLEDYGMPTETTMSEAQWA